MRIGHTVEHEQQRWLRRGFQDIIQRDVRQRGIGHGDDALMAIVTGELHEAIFIGDVDGNAGRFRASDKVAKTRIAARAQYIERLDRIGPSAQPRRDGVEAEEKPRGGHPIPLSEFTARV